jgi:type I restriction enzyme S subunit
MVKAYPKYQNTRLPWLEKMPDGWQIKRGKAVFRCIDVRSKDGDEELLTVSSKDGVVPRSSKKITMFMAESYAGYKLCWPGDLVINSLWAWMFGLGFSRHHGIVSSAYGVYRPHDEYVDYWKYFDYLFRSKAYDWELRVRSQGIWTSRLQLTDDRFLDMPVLIPPKEEAGHIVNFLSVVDLQVRHYIRAKQKVIRDLNEQKQAIINEIVTRGVNPSVNYKISGINWLSNIPSHWEVKPLKHWAKINQSVLSETTPEDFEFYYLDIGTVGTGLLEKEPQKLVFVNAPSRARRIVKKGDTIISTVRTYLKAVYFISEDRKDLIASTGFAVLTPSSQVRPELLSYVIQSNYFIDQVVSTSVGVAYPAIAETRLGALKIAMPIDAGEQKEIVEAIRTKTKDFDELICSIKKDISTIQEYRERLFMDVLIGKVDINGIKLPDLKEDPSQEPFNEPEDMEDSEEVVNADE